MPTPKDSKKIPIGAEQLPETNTQAPKTQAPQINSRVKPIVEGINSPKTTSDILMARQPAEPNLPNLTEQEKELISETNTVNTTPQPKARLMPEAVVKRQGKNQQHYKGIFITAIILLALIYAGYEFYVWRLEKAGNTATQNNYSSAPSTANLNNPAAGMASSTQNSGAATSTASGSLGSMPFPLAGGTSPATTTADSATTSPQILQLKISQTPTGYLNVRSAPSFSGKIIGQVHPGEIYTYTQTQGGWYFINIPEQDSGWVSARYAKPQ